METPQKTILLVTESDQGHHLAFMDLFVRSLLGLNCKVIVLMPFASHLKDHLHADIASQISFEEFNNVVKPVNDWGRFDGAFTALKHWRRLASTHKKIEKKHKLKFDVTFLAYLDVYLGNYLSPALVDFIFPYKWAGLYFHPKFLRFHPDEGHHKSSISAIDVALKAKYCIGVGIHDDKLLKPLAFRIEKTVLFFPEIADLTPPDSNHSLYGLLKEKANGRKIIGLVGCEKRKGFLTLLHLAKEIPEGYFFAFAGKFNPEGYTDREIIEVESFAKHPPANTYWHPSYLQEGTEINSFLAAMDIVYIVYKGFTSTSNFNTKAAFLKKPVLATEHYIIGDETREFGLGVCVKEENLTELQQALPILAQKSAESYRFDSYLKKHHPDQLQIAFRRLLRLL